ncbi:MAG TPA: phosphoesterase [Bacteroidia bacterium]|nr:phosphoesterase [Bacteroidia bacterium]
MIWFTSDNHFGHTNIIKYTKRPFTSVDEMDETMIERWNERIGPNDDVYHLGDVGLCPADQLREILDWLNGNIHLIVGNHEGAALQCKKRFQWVKDYYELKVPDEDAPNGSQKIVLLHYAMRIWNGCHRGTFHLYGHSHGTLTDDPFMRSLDAGVDSHNFYPISYQEVKSLMLKKQWTPPFKDRD